MQNTNEYTINKQKVIVERTFDKNAPDLIEILLKYFLKQKERTD